MDKHKFFASEKEVYDYFYPDAAQYRKLKEMHPIWRDKLMGYMTGKKTLPFTYDPFFKMVFNPENHADRLADFLSTIIGEKVEFERVIPVEHVLHDGSSTVMMDILVKLKNGARANVEIQKNASDFPDERISCYMADNVMQEYEYARAQVKGKDFSYRDVSKVYTIVIYENSKEKYKKLEPEGQYRHHGETKFDTGLELNLLDEYFIINLDIFKDKAYTRNKNKLNGWLWFLSTEDMEDVERIVKAYPWLQEIYEDIGANLRSPEEVLTMYSDTLRILGQNEMRFRMDELKQERDEAVQERDEAVQERDEAVQKLRERDAQLESACNESERKIKALEEELARLRRQQR